MGNWIATVSLLFGALTTGFLDKAPRPPAAASDPAAAAAQGSEPIRVDLKMDVLLVEFDVSVHDRKGNFISGLGRQQFHLFEDGREVPIADFEEMVQKAPQGASPDASGKGRSFLVFVDTYLASMRKVAQIRRDLVRFLSERLAPGDSLSLAILDGRGSLAVHPGVGQAEAAALAEDIALPVGHFATPETNTYEDARHVLAQVEESVTEVLDSNVPAPRSLIFLSPGFVPAEPDQAISTDDIAETIRNFAPAGMGPPRGGFDPFHPEQTRRYSGTVRQSDRSDRPENLPSIEALTSSLAGWLSARHITLYSINCGEKGPLDLFADNFLASEPGGGGFSSGLSIQDSMKLNILTDLAEMTGGLAWLNTRAYRRAFHDIDEATASVYRISFRPDTDRPRGRYHKLDVRVEAPKKVKVRHPRGYLDS
jgi:VWFA-related protein